MKNKFNTEVVGTINRSIKIHRIEGEEDLFLYVTKNYADKHLSAEAKKMAFLAGDNYVYIVNKTSAVVAFELPKVFNAQFHELLPQLMNYCMSYVRSLGLNDNVIYSRFLDNYKKA